MEWIAVKVVFEAEIKSQAIDLIAEIFYDLGVKGVQIEDPSLEPEEGWGPGTVAKPLHDAVIGYFPDTPRTRHDLTLLQDRVERLTPNRIRCWKPVCRRLDEADWAESWKAFFWPESITPRITVKPTWRNHEAKPNEIVLELDPGQAFGTGTHPTTALCVALLERYVFKDCRFLDVGTGSGILMIAAAKLGAGSLVGIDHDEIAIEVAGKNLQQNRIDGQRIELRRSDLTTGLTGTFDLVAANILSGPIQRLLDTIDRHLADEAVFICSGIYQDNRAAVARKMHSRGFKLIETRVKDDWVAMAARKRGL